MGVFSERVPSSSGDALLSSAVRVVSLHSNHSSACLRGREEAAQGGLETSGCFHGNRQANELRGEGWLRLGAGQMGASGALQLGPFATECSSAVRPLASLRRPAVIAGGSVQEALAVQLGRRWCWTGVLMGSSQPSTPGQARSPHLSGVALTPSHPQRLLRPDLASITAPILTSGSRLHLFGSWAVVHPGLSLLRGPAL